MGKNVNDMGYGDCPICNKWKVLTHYHPKDKKLPRRKKNKHCGACIQKVRLDSDPWERINRSIASHKSTCKEGDYALRDLKNRIVWQNHKCPYCGKSMYDTFTLDHVIPRKFEGKNVLANVLLVCLTCNSSKQHFELFYWLEEKGYRLSKRIFQFVKGAYDEHGYEFKGQCGHCTQEGRCKTGCGENRKEG